MGPRGQVSHCIALNSVDNFLQEDNEKEFISTEGCYSCKINGGGGGRSSRRSSRTVQRSRVSRHYSSSSRRSHHYRYRKKRLKRHDDMNAKFSSLRPGKKMLLFLFSNLFLLSRNKYFMLTTI